MSKKKNKPGSQQQLSPKKYIVTRARNLPIYKCLINKNWKEARIASIAVMRRHTNNHVTTGFYLVDLLARGVKDSHFIFNEQEMDVMERINDHHQGLEIVLEEVDYILVHNIIYGAVTFAEDNGIMPYKDFDITQYILEEDTDDIELIDIPFGIGGNPAFFVENEEDEEGEEGEEDDEWNPLYDYHTFTDDDWREFLNERIEISEKETAYIMDVLFQRWLDKHKPSGNRMLQLDGNEYEVTYDALATPHKGGEQEDRELLEIFLELNDDSAGREKIHGIEKKILDLISRYPDNPVFHNYLGICAQHRDDTEAYKTICRDTVYRFPDYLYGKIAWLNVLLDEQRLDEVTAFLGNTWHLHEICTSRKLFHITEFESYYGSLLRYFVRTGDLHHAHFCCELIFNQSEMEPDTYVDHGFTNVFDMGLKEFNIAKFIRIVEHTREIGIDASKMSAFIVAERR